MTKVRDSAMRLLCRREHSAYELAQKLAKKGFGSDEIQDEISHCQELDLQSDSRFTEILIRIRIRQGYGPLKILEELKTKQISTDIIDTFLSQEDNNWLGYATAVWAKKYKDIEAQSFEELQKRQRFLQYRGFPISIITEVVKTITDRK